MPSHQSATIDLWDLRLAASPAEVADATSMLSTEERDRAACFRFAPDRRRFIAAHGLVRIVLGRYLSRAPGELVFASGPRGKPIVMDSRRRLLHNLSHSGNRALLAVSDGAELGVDLEHATGFRLPDASLLAPRVLSAEELEAFARVRPSARPRALLQAWTRKEAALKALGDGLRGDPRRFSVRTGGDAAGVRVYDLALGRSYVGALASSLPVARYRCFRTSWRGQNRAARQSGLARAPDVWRLH